MENIFITRVSNDQELIEIRELQIKNLKKNLTQEQIETEGFVTFDYPLDFLKKMHSLSPSIIAKYNNKVIGYAIVATREALQDNVSLADFERTVNQIVYQNDILVERNYVVVGQLCVEKEFRGMGVTGKMYHYFRQCLSNEFDCAITDVAQNNPISQKAHIKYGFKVIHSEFYENLNWFIMLWDWKNY